MFDFISLRIHALKGRNRSLWDLTHFPDSNERSERFPNYVFIRDTIDNTELLGDPRALFEKLLEKEVETGHAMKRLVRSIIVTISHYPSDIFFSNDHVSINFANTSFA